MLKGRWGSRGSRTHRRPCRSSWRWSSSPIGRGSHRWWGTWRWSGWSCRRTRWRSPSCDVFRRFELENKKNSEIFENFEIWILLFEQMNEKGEWLTEITLGTKNLLGTKFKFENFSVSFHQSFLRTLLFTKYWKNMNYSMYIHITLVIDLEI